MHPWYPIEQKSIPVVVEENPNEEEANGGDTAQEEANIRDRKSSENSARSTEGTEGGSSEHKISQEFSLEKEKEVTSQDTKAEENVQYLEDCRLSKILLLLIESHFCKKDNDSQTQNRKISFSFLFIRILNMSMFSHIFNDKKWVKHYLQVLLSKEFRPSNFWMYYRMANKGDVEE